MERGDESKVDEGGKQGGRKREERVNGVGVRGKDKGVRRRRRERESWERHKEGDSEKRRGEKVTMKFKVKE